MPGMGAMDVPLMSMPGMPGMDMEVGWPRAASQRFMKSISSDWEELIFAPRRADARGWWCARG